jgi:hypothetical protein
LKYKEIAFRDVRRVDRFIGRLRKGSTMDMDPEVACFSKIEA